MYPLCVTSVAHLLENRIWKVKTSGTFGLQVSSLDELRGHCLGEGIHAQLPLSTQEYKNEYLGFYLEQ